VGEAGKKAPAGDDWDIAAVPSYNGKTTAAFNADTFRILKNSKHPDEAFTALVYLLTDGSKPLLDVYGGMPARTADQAAFFDELNKQFTQKPDWQVAIDSIQYADNPNFEAYVPAYNATFDQVTKFWSKLRATAGLDVDSEIARLEKDLQAIWDKAK
jgi:multiple sugar transport system substrate-binding protein